MNAITEPVTLIEAPCVIEGQPIEQYHGGPGISKTGLDHVARSPALFYALHLDPARPAEKERAGQLEGQLAHCAILEPAEFDKRYAVLPADAPRRPTEAQWNAKKPSPESIEAMEWWTAWNKSSAGRTIITHAQRETALRQAESVRRLPDVAEALAAGRPEVSAYWIDSDTGVLCRCRPDWVHPAGDNGVILLDVKTYSDASPAEFARQIARKRYHVQDAFYSDGYARAAGVDVLGFVFVAVETEWPFAASAVMLDEPGKRQGAIDMRRDLATYAACLKVNDWPGHGASIHQVSMPAWAHTNE
ncbi:PD-(D/E)XK nuclease-like domain-containing protein [Bordetella bronchiseptica]|uniref:PD-(D/E)XK nuclease-like domain-containing protein n=1 Tax=Bordetella bronchiseptica TaxID=518 RepID=UPI00045A7C38|nr:PD-(D/E)XK nuclease-like domain-containing protein [Bordetella bronchiseptica]KAK50237.1 PD-(D/E)XK nuclease family protein [Bordetella bronchiseptica OSU054]